LSIFCALAVVTLVGSAAEASAGEKGARGDFVGRLGKVLIADLQR
jgi:hypothetical protein